jgi:integrase
LPNWNTKRQYTYWFKRFEQFTGLTPEQMLAKTRDQDGRFDIDDLTKQFYNRLVTEGYSKGTASTVMHITRSFFAYNGSPLPKPPRGLVPTEASFEQRKALSQEELRQMMEQSDFYEKLILRVLAETGQRRGILTALKLKHIRDELSGKQAIVFQISSEMHDKDGRNVNKAKVGYRFGLTANTVGLLIQHLDERRARGEKLTSESWLLADTAGTPLYGERIRRIVIGAARRAGIQNTVFSEKLGRIAAIHPHIFRAFFKDKMLELGVREILVEEMLGHLVKYRGAYDRPTDNQIREIYAKAERSFL